MNSNQDINRSGMPGIWTPGEVAFNPYLTKTERFLYSIIINLAQTRRGCWATNDTLASYIDCTKTRTSIMISKLENYKYINIKRVKLKEGYTERRIYKNNFEYLYVSLSQQFNECIATPEKIDIQQILRDTIAEICCPGYPEKFDKDKGFNSLKGSYQKGNRPLHTCKPPYTPGETTISPKVKQKVIGKGNSKGNKESFLKKRACKQASLRNAISLNRKKPNTPVKHVRINSPVQKQEKRLRLDIESIQQACPECKQLFDYWNELNLIKHKDAPTKTKLNSYIQIQKFLKKHTVQQTKQAFDTYKKLCTEYPVKFSKQPYKVSLPDFFAWNPQQRQLVSLIDMLKNASGFVDICLQGVDHALDLFRPKNKLINKENKTYKRMSNEAVKLFGSVKVRRGSVDLQRATKRLEGFYNDRKRRFDGVSVTGLVPLLFSYVESNNDVGTFKLWWLNSENTFNGFEDWLEENGYLRQLSCFDRPDTVYGEDGRIVRCALP